MVEAIANGIEDKLVDGLSFKLNPGASYVVDRRSVTYHPQGSNIYKPSAGTKLIRIVLTGDNWLDPSTFRVMFDVNNDEHHCRQRVASCRWTLVLLSQNASSMRWSTRRRHHGLQPHSRNDAHFDRK